MQNTLLSAYDDIYVENNKEVKTTNATITVGQIVIDEAVSQYGTPTPIGDAKMMVAQEEEEQDADVTIVTRDFKQTGTISYDGGILTWDELEKNDGSDIGGAIAETNPDFFKYSNPDSNGNVTITGLSGGGVEAYKKNDENILNLVIPKKNKAGNTINKIGNDAFKGKNKIKKLILGDNITEIGGSAFQNCTALKGELKNIKNVTSIGGDAFNGCSGINGTLIIPKGVEIISNGAFLGTSITKVVIHENVTKIRSGSFINCSYLKDITIPITINAAGDKGNAFEGCKAVSKVKLTKGKVESTTGKDGIGYDYQTNVNTPWRNTEQNVIVEIAEGVEKIGKNTFIGCSKIQKVEFPKSLKEIGESAFENCTALNGELKNIENVISIGGNAFSGCSGINGTLIIPNGVGTISNGAFLGTSITKVVIHENVTQIYDGSFKNCIYLEDITLPITINAAGEKGNAFENCTKISKVRLTPGKNDNGEGFKYSSEHYSWSWYYTRTPWYRSTSGSKKIIIEKGVTKIGALTFEGVENATYYYTGTEVEWASVQGTSGITISTYNYSE